MRESILEERKTSAAQRNNQACADTLAPGDTVRTLAGLARVEAVAAEARRQRVHNLSIADARTFLVGDGGAWVHNCDTGVRVPDLGRKLEYLFGNATGRQHNLDRSSGMARSLNRIGISDNERGRSIVSDHFTKVLNSPGSILSQSGNKTTRESLLAGRAEFVKVTSYWDGDRLMSAIIREGR